MQDWSTVQNWLLFGEIYLQRCQHGLVATYALFTLQVVLTLLGHNTDPLLPFVDSRLQSFEYSKPSVQRRVTLSFVYDQLNLQLCLQLCLQSGFGVA